jgi:hypothetical protein
LSKKEQEEIKVSRIQLIFRGADVLEKREIALKKLEIINSEKEKLVAALSQEGLNFLIFVSPQTTFYP